MLSDESGIVENIAGRYSRGIPNFDVFLKGYSGSPVRVNRGSRPPIHLEGPKLTMALTPQPSILEKFQQNQDFRDRGMLGRFLFVMPPDNIGYRNLSDRNISISVRAKYAEICRHHLNARLPAFTSSNATLDVKLLTLSKDASDLWRGFYIAVEEMMRPDGELYWMRDWGGKLPGNLLRVAGLFHLAEGITVDSTVIEPKTMENAIHVFEALIEHAKEIFCAVNKESPIAKAHKIVERIKDKQNMHLTSRDCYRAHRGDFKSPSETKLALQLLCSRSNLTAHKPKEGSVGRPTETYFVNPTQAVILSILSKNL